MFNPLEKKLIAHRILDNHYNFIITTFFPQDRLDNSQLFLDYLATTEFSYCVYQTSKIHQSFSVTGEIQSTDYTKPCYLASVYNDLATKKFNYSRQLEFSHLLYLDYRLLLSLEQPTIDFLQLLCDRNMDFAIYNWLQNTPQSATSNVKVKPNFLICSAATQLYSLSKKSLLIWQTWQQIITKYQTNFRKKKSQVFPGEAAFLDYAWNQILRHETQIKFAWLEQQYFNYQWTPLARTLIQL